MQWTGAGERCPETAFGRAVLADGGVDAVPDGALEFGLCVRLHSISGSAFLNSQPASGLRLVLKGGQGESEYDGILLNSGQYAVKALAGPYDILYYQPAGVFLTHEGAIDTGPLDLREDRTRRLEGNSHTLAGTALFGGVPFVPTRAPMDIGLETFGASRQNFAAAQKVSSQSQSGAFEVKLLEGKFAVFLNAPPAALFGTELRRFLVSQSQVTFDRDQSFDIDIPTATIEGELLLDGRPLPDRRPGTDFSLQYTVPGEREPTVLTHHEGGFGSIAGLVPKAEYGITLSFIGTPDRQYPAQISNIPLLGAIDLRRDQRFSKSLATEVVEGSLSVDSVPVQPKPNSRWNMFMYGFAGMTSGDSFLEYRVPLESAAFNLRVFAGNYFTVLQLSDELAPELVEGWYVVDRYKQVQGPTTLPINIKTGTYQGRVLIDGKPPAAGVSAGTFWFANRAPEYRDSFFRRRVVTAEDGQFRIRLPIGTYDVYFVIDRDVYPEYAAGWQTAATQLIIGEMASVNDDIRYDTVLVTGPIRVDGQVLKKTIGGEEVGLRMSRGDGRRFTWGFSVNGPNYRMRVPPGSYDLDFTITQGALEGVAWGWARMGGTLRVGTPVAPR
jgi:hypothetical protein